MSEQRKRATTRSKMNSHLVFGASVLTAVILFSAVSPLFVNKDHSLLGSFEPELSPSARNLLGTDLQGRDIFATLVFAALQTLQVGALTGLISLALGAVMGVIAGFVGGRVDTGIRFFSDVLMAIPVIAFLMVFVARMSDPSIWVISLSIAALSWPGAARGIRAQVLSLRERQYIAIARANGEHELGVLFREVLPNVLSLLLAQFIGAVQGGIGTAMSLEVLGLVPTRRYLSLGLMLFWVRRMGGILRGMWWWWGPPIVLIALIFTGLLFLSSGMNIYVNPRLAGYGAGARRRTQARLKKALTERRAAGAHLALSDEPEAILHIKNLSVEYETPDGAVRAVDKVSFSIRPGERMGLIGESGSGKTTMATALLRLSRPPAFIVGGQVFLNGRDLLALEDEELQKVRLKEIALVPQAAMNALNPVMRIDAQIKDAVAVHMGHMPRKEMDDIVAQALSRVDLPVEVAKSFPHQLSGGMKQRATMAIAVALQPRVIIADEPTSALDVVVQKRVMMTLVRLQEELGAAVLLIGHDIGLITQFADTLGVLYAGKLVEWGRVIDILDSAYHPYSRLLIDSLPTMDERKQLVGIPGMPPELLNLPPGCPFAPRCPFAFERCRIEEPEIQLPRSGHQVACHLYPEHSTLSSVTERIESQIVV